MTGMSTHLDFDDPDSEIALFRYGLIASLAHDPPASGKLENALRQIAAKRYEIPHSRRTRVSISSIRRYLAAFRKGGFEALKPHARSDAGTLRAFDQSVLDRALALRAAQPDRTTPMIVEHLKREDATVNVNAHTLDTHLRKAGKTRRMLAKTRRVFRRFEREHPSSLWQGDAMQGPWLPDPQRPDRHRRAYLFAFIDDYSRFVPYAEWFYDEQLPRLERVFKLAILRRGLPKAVYVDNGSVYRATQFGAACASLGIKRLHSQPYQPEGRGKIERFFHTVRMQFLPETESAQIDTLDMLNESFWAWLDQVYHARAHTETGQPPFERFTTGPDFAAIAIPDPETLRQAFLWRAKRKVSSHSTLQMFGNTYHVDLGNFLRGDIIELRFDPFDLSHVDIYQHGKFVAPVTLVHQKRQRHLLIDRLAPEPQKVRSDPRAGADFLARLRDEQAASLRKQIGAIRFSNLDSSPSNQQE
jgi:putative transposase